MPSTYELDSELVPVMAGLRERAANSQAPARGDWRAVRQTANAGQAYMATLTPSSSGVKTTTFFTTASDGAKIELRLYQKTGVNPGSAVVYVHGGGIVAGSINLYDKLVSW